MKLFRVLFVVALAVGLLQAVGAPSAVSLGKSSPIELSTTSASWGHVGVGLYDGVGKKITVTNVSSDPVALYGVQWAGTNPADFFGETNCANTHEWFTLAAGDSCWMRIYFAPIHVGIRKATLRFEWNNGASGADVSMTGAGTEGYFVATDWGGVGVQGDANYYGDARNLHLKAPIITMAPTLNGGGYWLLGRDGGIFSFGNAHFYGSTGAMKLNKPIVSMARTSTGKGYWLVAADGGMFSFGDAKYYGSLGSTRLSSPVVGIAVAPDGKGYWMVTAAGAVYHFGSAKYYGQPLALHPRSIVQIAPTPTGRGYFVLSSDSHLYTYGDATYHGAPVGRSASGIAVTSDGRGYWIGARNGAVATFGNAPYYGQFLGASTVAIAPSDPFLDPFYLRFSASSVGAGNRGRLTPTGTVGQRRSALTAAP